MRTQRSGRPAIVIRAGDLDAYTAPGFLATLTQTAWVGSGTVVIDLDDTEFFDEAGIELIISASEHAAASGCRFGVVCTRWPILRMLRAAGLDTALNIASSADELIMRGNTGPGLTLRGAGTPSERDAS